MCTRPTCRTARVKRLVTHDAAGITVRRVHEKGTIALRGGASDLLLVLLQRFPPDTPAL